VAAQGGAIPIASKFSDAKWNRRVFPCPRSLHQYEILGNQQIKPIPFKGIKMKVTRNQPVRYSFRRGKDRAIAIINTGENHAK